MYVTITGLSDPEQNVPEVMIYIVDTHVTTCHYSSG